MVSIHSSTSTDYRLGLPYTAVYLRSLDACTPQLLVHLSLVQQVSSLTVPSSIAPEWDRAPSLPLLVHTSWNQACGQESAVVALRNGIKLLSCHEIC